MTANPLVSIIIPVYKVEPYLSQCVDSVINQTYSNLEIILVDDGSPDNCPKICDEYKQKDLRIKVIHKPNGGLSDARNAGMKIATANYFCFVDSDDVCHTQMIEMLMKPITENETLKISACSYTKIPEKWNGISVCKKEYSVEKKTAEQYMQTELWMVAWGKIYAKELFNKIEYPKGRLHEDEFTTYKLIYDAKTVAFIDSPYYLYRQREGSIMGTVSIKNIIDTHDALKEKLDFIIEKQLTKIYGQYLIDFCNNYCFFKKKRNYLPEAKTIMQKWKNEISNFPKAQLNIIDRLHLGYMLNFTKIRNLLNDILLKTIFRQR